NEQLRVRQLSAVAGLTSNWNTARALAAALPSPLPAPRFTAEPRTCTNVVSLTQVFVGIRVYYSRAGVPDGSAIPNASSVNLFFAGSPLSNGEAFGVKNVLDGCQIQSVETTQRAVSRVPDAPVIVGKLCAGADTVNIAGLVPGALVEIQQDGVVVGTGYAAAEQAPFKIAPLGASRTIRVRQGLCTPTTWSAFSGTVTTGSTSGALPLPTVEPVYDCGLVARVRNVEPGTRVEILSNINGTMGTVPVAVNATMADPVDVPLNRKAAAGETLTARVSGCSQAARTSAGVLVELALVRQLAFSPAPEASTTFVSLVGAVPGATVEVLHNGVAVASAVAASDTLTIELPEYLGLLRVDDRLVAYQYFCNLANVSPDATANAVAFQPWRVINTSLDILAVHTAVFPSGRVLLFGGSEHNHEPKATRNTNASRVYDPVTNTLTVVGSPNFDLFCCGHAMMADGRLMAAGGTIDYPVDQPPGGTFDPTLWVGAQGAAIFDDSLGTWTRVSDMAGRRWYPSLVTLSDGRVVVGGGADKSGASYWETFDPATGNWTTMPSPNNGNYYPRLLVVPGGVLDNQHGSDALQPAIVNPANGARTVLPPYLDTRQVPPDNLTPFHLYNYGVLLLPITATTTTPEALFVGGQMDRPYTIRVAAGQSWTSPAPLNDKNRFDACASYVADGTILLSGGGVQRTADGGSDPRAAEQFVPATRTFVPREDAAFVRKYHSCTVLLRDGRLLSVGGQKAPPLGNYLGNNQGGCAQWRKNPAVPTCDANVYPMEDYRPTYLRVGPRPTIAFAPDSIPRGTPFVVGCPQAWDITRALLLRVSSFTHAGSTDMRCIELAITGRRLGAVTLGGTPASAELVVPGFYFLFLLRTSGAASVGWPIRI
ncbi:MAG: DUF1929 domain-containing protein, partial [Polyangiaceae bacterium]|nr:DUF1929 domain-containing protein [Polyangiaceae bacterium]